ncbi:tetratricopeptide repeat protein [bacterium]|nr:tetratricopeptide repeat protein [bacterium]
MNLDLNKSPTVDELLSQIESHAFIGTKGSLTQNEESPSPSDIQDLRTSAEVLISARDYALARNILLTMVRNGTLVGWALRTMGKTYEFEENLDRARRCFQDAIAYEPHLEAYRCLASLEIRSKNDAAAADALERALNLRDLLPNIRFEIHKASGNCWMRAQRMEKAEHHYKRALSIDPTSDQISSNLGALYLQSGRIRDAQRFFEDALVANPSNSRALSGLGAAYLAEGKKREAHDQFARSLQIDLNQPNSIYHLVKCAYEIKSYATAARILGDYVQVSPVNANLLYSLAGFQFHLGRIDEARATVSKILQIQPTHTGANELSKLIERYAVSQSNRSDA